MSLDLPKFKLKIKSTKEELCQIKELEDILIKNKSIIFHGYVDEINDFIKK